MNSVTCQASGSRQSRGARVAAAGGSTSRRGTCGAHSAEAASPGNAQNANAGGHAPKARASGTVAPAATAAPAQRAAL